MAEENQTSGLPVFRRVERVEALRVVLLGVAVGIIVPLLSAALSKWVIDPIFCQDPNSFTVCANGGMIAYYISTSLITIAAIALLVNWGIYRPLIIAVGALVALWGLKKFIDPIAGANFVEYIALSAALFGVNYLLFFWFMQVRHFGVSIALAVVAAVAIRWTLLV
ncbi:MAG TPA: hypothetical protein VFT87_04050 [Candidatus Saccharimonadales bacterium]|nr:hypothetical protein [Candidatus Saccharimonadales bacterium]